MYVYIDIHTCFTIDRKDSRIKFKDTRARACRLIIRRRFELFGVIFKLRSPFEENEYTLNGKTHRTLLAGGGDMFSRETVRKGIEYAYLPSHVLEERAQPHLPGRFAAARS